MSYDWLLEPLSDDAPCGPDLAATDDDAFAEYYYGAEARMPERYVIPGMEGSDGSRTPDRVFDQKSIDIKAEKSEIDTLLQKSRDLRLLSLLARFQCLAGRLGGIAEATGAMAALLDAHPDAVNPGVAKSTTDRRAALEDLAATVTMTIPLQYINLIPDGKVTYRGYLVASGQAEPREGEDDLNASDMISALGAPSAKDHVEKANAWLTQIAGDIDRMVQACKAHPDKPFTPGMDRLKAAIADIQSFIQMGRADLSGYVAEPTTTTPEEESPAEATPAAPSTPIGEALAVDTQAAAQATLEAIERYFATHEPASAALLLVTQARFLVGKPLVVALEALLPEHARAARIDFGPETGFILHMDRLRELSSAVPQPQASDAPPPAPPAIANRADAAKAILGVEEYFRRNEPASPVPVLLLRARSYLDKDFHALVRELIPAPPKEPQQG